MAHSSRGWTGARTPSAIKRVRQNQRRRQVNQPRRTAAKTLISKALVAANDVATNGGDTGEVRLAVERAVSALDRAAKIGAIHRNAADRRKSRLMLKVNAALAGEGLTAPAKMARTTGKAAATKQAKARIAASKATKAKGAQTAAGKARAALSRTTRATVTETETPASAEPTEPKKPARTRSASGTSAKAAPKKATTKAASEAKPRARRSATTKKSQ